MLKLLADGREFVISPDTWDAWKGAAEPFELPDDVLRRLLGVGIKRETTNGVGPTYDRGSTERRKKESRWGAQGPRSASKRSRVPSDLLLPETEYELPILQALASTGGRRPTREVVEEVGRVLDGRLTEVDREPVRAGEPPRWQGRVQFTRLRLVKAGLLKPDSPRGVWELSAAGERRLTEISS